MNDNDWILLNRKKEGVLDYGLYRRPIKEI